MSSSVWQNPEVKYHDFKEISKVVAKVRGPCNPILAMTRCSIQRLASIADDSDSG
jgi:hypothetical protein